jgi:hypothetical protein
MDRKLHNPGHRREEIINTQDEMCLRRCKQEKPIIGILALTPRMHETSDVLPLRFKLSKT